MKKTLLYICVLMMITGCGQNEEVSIIEESPDEYTVVSTPKDYFLPKISIKSEYKDGIIYEQGDEFNIDNYVETKCYKDKCHLYYELANENITDYKTEGTHNVIIGVKDECGGCSSLKTKLVTFTKDDVISADSAQRKPGHYELVLDKEEYDETVPAYDEKKLVKQAWIEEKLIQEAYSEEVEYCKEYGRETYFAYICTGCGYIGMSSEEIHAHIEADWEDSCGSFSGQNIPYGDQHCLLMDSYTLYHNPVYDYIYHDAEYEMVHHEEQIIHHDAKYKRVYIED